MAEGDVLQRTPTSLAGPFRKWDAAALDDRPHGAKRKHPASMVRDNYLFAAGCIAPLLVASGLSR